MRRCDILVLTPPTVLDPSIAIAACRAGAAGTLDLEYCDDSSRAVEAVRRLEKFTTSSFGIKIGVGGAAHIEQLLDDFPARLKWVLFAGDAGSDLDSISSRLREAGVEILVEATSRQEIEAAAKCDPNGIVLKGHESGGRVGEDTAFILIQHWLQWRASQTDHEVVAWVQGGIGTHTAAACAAAGVRGVVLDTQLLLTRESPLDDAQRQALEACDGSESLCIGSELGMAYRVFHRPGEALADVLLKDFDALQSLESNEEQRARWQSTVRQRISEHGCSALALMGQDAALAKPLADRFVTVGGVVEAIVDNVRSSLQSARTIKPLAAGAPLAKSHGTKYPILQGPMTRVSDTAPFAKAVADSGGLPFLALALMRGPDVRRLLIETDALLADQSWGVGVLGFLPPEIRKEQIEVILELKPPLAIIAGGRPDQAEEFEDAGIPTYLHVPSPGLLRMFLRDGARRFIFEGRECGGHVGPRGSFLLWESMCDVLLEHLGPKSRGEDLHLVFAGGIHDANSAAMVAAMAAPLAERGMRVGVLMGTAYLYTQEAVETGAIVPQFQEAALTCDDTVLLETAPGHAVRCVRTPYCDAFQTEKNRLQSEGKSHDEIVRALEWMNLGRLRVASKGLDRVSRNGGPSKLSEISQAEQLERGMYMIGQVSTLRSGRTTMAELHEEVSLESVRLLEKVPTVSKPRGIEQKPCDIAIIGMDCIYPGSDDLTSYWNNILDRTDEVTEIPPSHWDWELYYDEDPRARDKIISKWGGFMGDTPFNPMQYGIAPASMRCIEPLQLLLLESVRRALDSAGYSHRPFNRERTSAILGIGGGGSPLATMYGFRTCLPMFATMPGMPEGVGAAIEHSQSMLPEWTEDSFPGFLMNVAVGRVANRFNFGGTNMAIDAACASSLAALHASIRELETGTADVAVAMGADTVSTPFSYMAFSKTYALSARGRCSPFDAAADGIVLSEGIGVVVLKRLADAERDGDRILAVIKGVGSSSDGKEKGLTAPNAAGQLRALRRAYAQAGISPRQVGLIEAHGTGTVVGDRTEAESLATVMREAGADLQSCALGSVKSMIGHSKCAAGVAGLIKTTQAIHRKVLPPMLVDEPNPRVGFDKTPLYLNTEARPWVHRDGEPRYAGVSAFGFGGTNFHVVLEEYRGNYLHEDTAFREDWPAELVVFRRKSREALGEALRKCHQSLTRGAKPRLRDLAAAAWRASGTDASMPTAAMVVHSLDDLRDKLPSVIQAVRGDEQTWQDPRGLYFAESPADRAGKLAVLFPGQGSQYPNMLSQMAMAFPEIRRVIDHASEVLKNDLERPLGHFIYPPSSFTDEQAQHAQAALARTDVAQSALGAVNLAMFRLLQSLGVQADALAGHSYGEYVALCAAGCLSEADLIRLSYQRGHFIREATEQSEGTMAAVEADANQVADALGEHSDITIANLNSPRQTVIAGEVSAVDRALGSLEKAGLKARKIPVSCAFHSSHVAPAAKALEKELRDSHFNAPKSDVYSNTTASLYPDDPAEIVDLLAEHLTSPVHFQQQIEAMYEAGVRTFVEVGPQGVLTGLVKQTLGDRTHTALPMDLKGRDGLVQLQQVLAQLVVSGAAPNLDRLYHGRCNTSFALADIDRETGGKELPPNTWLVNGVRARLANEPEPWILGQRIMEHQNVTPAGTSGSTSRSSRTSSTTAPMQPTPQPPTQTVGPSPGSNGASQPLAPMEHAPVDDEAAQVVMGFQNLMARFLDTQRSIMLSYLQGTDGEAAEFVEHLPHASNGVQGTDSSPIHMPPVAAASENGLPVAHEVDNEPLSEDETNDEPVEAIAASPEHSEMSLEQISADLMDLVSKRTGYPKDMLDLDLDLEADLGIDSIKRVEILGTLAESIGGTEEDLESKLEIEKLTSIRTLREILDYLEEVLFGDNAETEAKESPKAAIEATNGKAEPPVEGALDVQRALIRLIEAPLQGRGLPPLLSGCILITDDQRGVACELADRLADFGQQTAIIRCTTEQQAAQDGIFYADLTDEQAVASLLEEIRDKIGAPSGMLHLMPLEPLTEGEPWNDRARRDLKSLYLLARALEPDLQAAGKQGGAFCLSTTALGGGLGYDEESLAKDFNPGQGGVLGFVKCLDMEWPDVVVRAIDFDAQRPVGELVDHLISEMGESDGPNEVGYLSGRRVTWEPYQATLETDGDAALELDKNSTILITGGARGITATVALEIARRYQGNIILVGRSESPPDKESSDTAGFSEPSKIKGVLIKKRQDAGQDVNPAEIEAEYQRLMRAREMRDNLQSIKATGARLQYHSLDVRDEAAFGKLIDDVTKEYDGIDGVIHGAGVIEDKLVRDKTPESFDRVFDTKVESALILSRHLQPKHLKFCVFFSSVVSRYGNRGQADYAAANEVLGKLAADLNRRWDARVVAIDWGPWSGAGMVANLERHFTARGLKLISPETGPVFVIEELLHGGKNDFEVIVAGGAERLARPQASTLASTT